MSRSQSSLLSEDAAADREDDQKDEKEEQKSGHRFSLVVVALLFPAARAAHTRVR